MFLPVGGSSFLRDQVDVLLGMRQATARGCKYAYVDTMDYQAPDFYRAHGFAIVGEIPDWDSHGHKKFYLSKCL